MSDAVSADTWGSEWAKRSSGRLPCFRWLGLNQQHLRFLDSLSRCQESRWLAICLSAQLNRCACIHRGHWVFVWVSTTRVRPYYSLRQRMKHQNHRQPDLCTKFFFSFLAIYSTGKRGSMRRKSFMIGSSEPLQPTGLDEDFVSVVIQHVTVWGLLLATALN